VEQLYAACGTVSSCKLIKFDDTGRCNGQAYVSFDTDDGAKKALKLSGTTIDNPEPKIDKKKQKKAPETKRKELKLKVSQVKNRRATKKAS
jgi:RNA recognition motif-containing protein